MKVRRAWAVVLLGMGLAGPARSAKLPPLPQLDLAHVFPGVRQQIENAATAARQHPTDPEATGKLGMVLDAYQQYAAAAVCYRRAHLLAPTAFQWVYNLAYVEMKLGQYQQAAQTFRAAIRMQPSYLPARLNLGRCLLAIGQWSESQRLYSVITKNYPDNPEAFYGLGRAEAEQGETASAAVALERACRLFPRYGAAHYALALAYRKLGHPRKAKRQFIAYQANATTDPPAVDPLRAAVQQLNQAPLHYLQRGLALAQEGNLQAAIQAHLKAIALDPDFVQPYINLIQLYARVGDYTKAEEEYRAAVRLNPHRSDCYYNYGVLMFGLGKYAEAEQAFRKAVEINPYYAQAHNNLGFLLEQQGHLRQALQQFQQAVEDQPDYRLARFHMGQILANQGHYAEAIRQFRKILTPDDDKTPTFLYALGATYARAGNFPQALTTMRKAEAEASARGQTQLVTSIQRDLRALENNTAER